MSKSLEHEILLPTYKVVAQMPLASYSRTTLGFNTAPGRFPGSHPSTELLTLVLHVPLQQSAKGNTLAYVIFQLDSFSPTT